MTLVPISLRPGLLSLVWRRLLLRPLQPVRDDSLPRILSQFDKLNYLRPLIKN